MTTDMTNNMNYGLQQTYGTKTGNKLDRKKFSSFALVVAIHLILGAVLLTGLTQTYVTPGKLVPIVILPPVIKPPQLTPKSIELPVASRVLTLPVIPVPDFPIDLPPTAIVDTRSASDGLPPQGAGPTTSSGGEVGTSTAVPTVGVVCPNSREVQSNMAYPAVARRAGIQGDVIARFLVGANGTIRDIAIVSSSSSSLNRAVVSAVAQFRCTGQGHEVAVEAPFSFRLHE